MEPVTTIVGIPALVFAVVEVAKRFGLKNVYAIWLALVLALGLNFIWKFVGAENAELLLGSIVIWLSAVGGYEFLEKFPPIKKLLK